MSRMIRWIALGMLFGLGAATGGFAQAADEDGDPMVKSPAAAGSQETTDLLTPIPDPDPQLIIDSQGLSGARIASLAISPDGRHLAVAGGKEVRVWDLKAGELRATLRGYQDHRGYRTGNVNTVVFSPDSRFLIVGVSDNTKLGSTRIYAIDDLTKLHALVPGHVGCTQFVAFSPSGKYLATAGCDGHVRVVEWNAATGKAQDVGIDVTDLDSGIEFNTTFPGHFCFPLNDDWLLVQPCGKLVVISVSQRKTIVDQAEWPEEIRSLVKQEHNFLNRIGKRDSSVRFTTSVCVMPRGPVWLVRGGTERSNTGEPQYWVGVWDRNGRGVMPASRYDSHRFHPVAVTYNETNGLAASADMLGEIHVWKASSGKQLWCFKSINRQIYRVAWSADGQELLFGDHPYPQDKYHYNRCGAISAAFRLKNRCIVPARALPDEPIVATAPSSSVKAQLMPTLVRGRNELQLQLGELSWPVRPMVGDHVSIGHGFSMAAISSYRFAVHSKAGMGDLRFYIGMEDGGLFQLSLAPNPDAKSEVKVRRSYLGHQNMVTSMAESPDGKLLATSAIDGTIRLWKIDKVHSVGDVDFGYDGMRVTLVGPGSKAALAGLVPGDEIVKFDGGSFYERLRKMARGQYWPGQVVTLEYRRNGETRTTEITLAARDDIAEPLMTLFLDEQGEWVMWTDSGYYDASSRGEQFVGWHVNRGRADPAKFYTVGQLRKHLYRPDVITALLADPRDSAVALKRANQPLMAAPSAPKAGLDLRHHEDFQPLEPPVARIVEPGNDGKTEKEIVEAKAEVVCVADCPIVKATFLVDGRPVPGVSRLDTEIAVGGKVRRYYSQSVPLSAGANKISFRAATKDAESQIAQVAVRRESAVPTLAKPKLCVLSIGISKHQDSRFNLNYADQDAEDFAAAWERQQGQLYSRVERKVVTNADATVRGIKDAMQWVSTTADNPRDTVVVLIAGHGLYDANGVWYLATHELDLEHMPATTISYAEISLWLDQQIRGNVILFVDTCHAGSVLGNVEFSSSVRERIQATGPRGVDLWRGNGSLVLASSLPSEESVERDDLRHGVFTQALLRALDGNACDIDHDGKLTFTEIELFVKHEVFAMSQGRQNASAHKPLTVSEVVLARTP